MSFSYTLPIAADLDRVRLKISDTTETPHVFEDEEITELLASEGEVRLAAAAACRIMATDTARRAKSLALPGLTLDSGKAVQQLLDMADKFEAEATQRAVPSTADIYPDTDVYYDSISGAHDVDFERP